MLSAQKRPPLTAGSTAQSPIGRVGFLLRSLGILRLGSKIGSFIVAPSRRVGKPVGHGTRVEGSVVEILRGRPLEREAAGSFLRLRVSGLKARHIDARSRGLLLGLTHERGQNFVALPAGRTACG